MPTVYARADTAILENFLGEVIFYGRQTDSDALQAIKELGGISMTGLSKFRITTTLNSLPTKSMVWISS